MEEEIKIEDVLMCRTFPKTKWVKTYCLFYGEKEQVPTLAKYYRVMAA